MLATVKVTLESVGPYSQSQKIPSRPPGDERTHEQYDRDSVWLKAHFMPDGKEICVPGQAFKMAIDTAAKRLAMKHPDGGKKLLTKNFLSGVMCFVPVSIGLTKESAGVWIDTIEQNTDGVRGSGKRAPRSFPVINHWKAIVEFTVVDDVVGEEAFLRALVCAGQTIGIGRWRAENGGAYGRFVVVGAPQWNYDAPRTSMAA